MSVSVTTIDAKLQREDIANRNVLTSGTISTAGTAVTGSGSMFTSEAAVNNWLVILDASGDFLRDAEGDMEARIITATASDTAATIGSAFTTAASGSDYAILKFLTVPGVVDTTGPTATAAQIDNTTQDDGKFTSKTAGLFDTGTFDFNLLYRPSLAAHAGLVAETFAQRDGFLIKWYSDGKATAIPPNVANSRILMFGQFGDFSPASPANDNEQSSCNFLVAGKWTVFGQNA